MNQVQSLELMIVQKNRDGFLQEDNSLVEVVDVQHFVDHLVNLIFFSNLGPERSIERTAAESLQGCEDRIFYELREAGLMDILAHEVNVSKGHLVKVETDKVHEEEKGKKTGTETSNVRGGIKEL